MDLAEMIDARLGELHPCTCIDDYKSRGRYDPQCVYHAILGDGEDIVRMMIEYGHLPPDANTRSAGQTADEIERFQLIRRRLIEGDA